VTKELPRVGKMLVNKLKETIEILETLTEQGFIEWDKRHVSSEDKELLECLYDLDVVDRPREVSGAYGAVLISMVKADALKRVLKLMLKR